MKETKKPLFKKWWVWLIAVLLLIGIIGAIIEGPEEDKKKEPAAAEKDVPEKVEKEEPAELSREEEIQAIIADIVEDEFPGTVIDKIAVNENMGQDDESFIVLPYFTWEVQNKVKTTREMLEKYSDRLAAKLADESDISEITVFWEVPYHLEGDNVAKFNYERSEEEMLINEPWYAPLIRE